ncbi:MAG: prolipoprotein diacylglyceryl transferase [Cyclobacteriaceae bacterium]
MDLLAFIIWSPEPEIFPNIDWIQVRWYGLMFALGFIISQQIMYFIYKKDGRPEVDVDTLTIFMIIATILGARLGHVLFYEPEKYLTNPLNILKIWEGGLASHGGAFGILTALYLYSNYYINLNPFKKLVWKKRKRVGQSFLWVVDRVVIVVALTGALIRLGNFINSEIIGKPTENGSGVVFAHDVSEVLKYRPYIEHVAVEKTSDTNADASGYVPIEIKIAFNAQVQNEGIAKTAVEGQIASTLRSNPYITDHIYLPELPFDYQIKEAKAGRYSAVIQAKGIPRHPAQLYESISSFLLFLILFILWYKKHQTMKEGWIFGIFLIILFGLRFLYEYLKENQVEFENSLPLNMGQWLSIPLILAGIYLLLNLKKFQPKTKV